MPDAAPARGKLYAVALIGPLNTLRRVEETMASVEECGPVVRWIVVSGDTLAVATGETSPDG